MSAPGHHFTDSDSLAGGLAGAVAAAISGGLAARGVASLAVSGGKTPLLFFDALSRQQLDWEKVFITLVDERWVPSGDARSNTDLVYGHLLQNAASTATFVPMVNDAATPEAGLASVTASISTLPLPFDAVILGMGDDGHTASWFPHGDHLAAALEMSGKAPLLPMRAPGAPEPRITFTAPVLLSAKNLFLHFEGANKRAVYDKAMGEGKIVDMPIRAALRRTDVQVYWCG